MEVGLELGNEMYMVLATGYPGTYGARPETGL